MDLDSVLNALANALKVYVRHKSFNTSDGVNVTVGGLKNLALKTVNVFSVVGDVGTRNAYLAAIKRSDREALLALYSDIMVVLDLSAAEYTQLTNRMALGAHVHYKVNNSHRLGLPYAPNEVSTGFYESPTLLVLGLMSSLGHQHWSHIEASHAEVRK